MANRDEVEEFLRRAAARRAAAQQQQQRPPVPPPQPAWTPPPPQPAFQPRPQQPVRRPANLAEVVILEPVQTISPVEAEVVDAELAEQPDRLGRYVVQDLRGAQEIEARTRQLGAEVDQADEKLEAHLQQVFDHSVGRLKKQATDSVPKTPEAGEQAPLVTAASIAELFCSPPALRNAIILAEVLHRPEERW
jgi:hypothetical protein